MGSQRTLSAADARIHPEARVMHKARRTVSWGGTRIATQPRTRRALDNDAPTRLCRGQIQPQRGLLCDVLSRLPTTGGHGQAWVRNRIS
jgi:hypothetical protein